MFAFHTSTTRTPLPLPKNSGSRIPHPGLVPKKNIQNSGIGSQASQFPAHTPFALKRKPYDEETQSIMAKEGLLHKEQLPIMATALMATAMKGFCA
jgi:hypothetical protein